jgi:AcrR family transcriptional regulator
VLRRAPQQARGQQRVDTILDAAEGYFADVGYDAATTNRLATLAGVAVGSIYQFFPNKEAILQAVVGRYRTDALRRLDEALGADVSALSVPEIVSRIIDVAIAMGVKHKGFVSTVLTHVNAGPIFLSGQQFRSDLVQRISSVIGARAPQIAPAERQLYASVSQAMFGAHLVLALQALKAGDRALGKRIIEQAKLAQTAYFERLLAAAG